MTGMDNTIEQAAQVLIGHPLGTPQGGTARGAFVLCGCGTVVNGASRDHAHAKAKRHIARALAESGLLVPAPHIVEIAEGIRVNGKTHGWRTRQGLAASMFQLVDLILGPDPDPPAPVMIPTPDSDDWDF